MKLYTEEQVKSMLNRARIFDGDVKDNFVYILSDADILSAETSIELPSADEILYESQGVFVNRIDMYEEGFIDGAEWVVNKIKGGEQ